MSAVEADAGRMVEEVLARYGRLDILVNNAGAPQGADRNEIEDVPVEAWDLTMGVNARGAFLMSRAAVPAMRKAKWGRIVSVSSKAAFRPGQARATYAASKAAIVGFTKSLALDLAPYGITVNAVCPGPIRTSRAISTNRREYGDDLEIGFAERAKAIPVGRFGSPDEVAAMIAFLASDQAAFRDRPGDRRRRRLVIQPPRGQVYPGHGGCSIQIRGLPAIRLGDVSPIAQAMSPLVNENRDPSRALIELQL